MSTAPIIVVSHGLAVLILLLLICSQAQAETIVISNERSGDLVFMSDTGESAEVLRLCARPRGMAYNSLAASLFIACSDDSTVIELDLVSRQQRRLFDELPGAMSLAFHASTERLIVSNEGMAMATVLDVKSGDILARLNTGLEPDGVAVTQDGGLILIASENAGMVHVYDGKSYEELTRLITNLRPRRLAIRAQELWVSSEMGSRVEIFDLASLQKIDEVIFAPRGFRSEQLTPVDILFDADSRLAFIALGSANHVAFVDAETREIIKYILVGRRPWGLDINADENRLYVLNGLSDDVTIIDIEKQRPIRTVRTGLVPHAVEIID